MTRRCLSATNGLVYAHGGSDAAKHRRAVEVLGRWGASATGALSAQVLAEFASVALRKLQPPMSPDVVYRQIERFETAFVVLPVTASVVLEAVRGVRDHQLAYYDAQLWALAKLAQIPALLSEDFQTGATTEGVMFVNPFAAEFDVGHFAQ